MRVTCHLHMNRIIRRNCDYIILHNRDVWEKIKQAITGTVPVTLPGTAGTVPGTVLGTVPGTIPGTVPGTITGRSPVHKSLNFNL